MQVISLEPLKNVYFQTWSLDFSSEYEFLWKVSKNNFEIKTGKMGNSKKVSHGPSTRRKYSQLEMRIES